MHPPPRRRRWLVTTALAIVLAGPSPMVAPVGVSVATAAEATADIPGVPLPGPVAAGRLGGDVYDVVYSFVVAPGQVIVASLTGAVGTDFDIYLFDGTATTVLSTVGLLTKSTGPTSTESISWATQSGGTFYIDLNGATDVEGDFRLTVQTIPDGTPPQVAVSLANGRPSTNQLTMPVTLIATDDLSGVVQMAFSTDGQIFEAWRPFQATTTWSFPTGDGQRFLWVKVKNGVGLESAASSTSIVIDTVAPQITSIDPVAGSAVAGLRPTLSVTFSEPIEPASWTNLGLIVQSATGGLVGGTYTYDVATRRGRFVPSQALVAGGLYVVTVGDVRDVAGNRVEPPGSWSFTALAETTITAFAQPPVVLHGQSARISASLAGAPLPATLQVSSASAAGSFEPLTVIPTDDGTDSLAVTPASNTTYRFRYPGADGVAPSEVDVRVLVRRSVILVGRSSSIVSRARVGSAVKLTASVGPAAAGVPLSFRLYRFDPARRRWVYAGSRGRSTDTSGRASYTWSPPASGSYYWRVAVAPTPEFANNTSPVYRWSISR